MQNRNSITFYFDDGHGFIGLKYQPDKEKKPIHFQAGLYPASRCVHKKNKREKEGTCSAPKNSSKHAYSSFVAQDIVLPLMITRMPAPIFSSAIGLKASILPSSSDVIDQFNGVNEQYCIKYEGHLGYSIESNINFQFGEEYYTPKYLQTMPQITYEISDEAARRVFDKVKYLVENCDQDFKFTDLSHNCLVFAKEMAGEAGLNNTLFSDFYKKSFGFKTAGFYMRVHDSFQSGRVDGGLVFSVLAVLLVRPMLKNALTFFNRKTTLEAKPAVVAENPKNEGENAQQARRRNCCTML